MDRYSDVLLWRFKHLRKTVENLLFFLECPDGETTSRPEWLEAMSGDIEQAVSAVASGLTDSDQCTRIATLKVHATHFANLLHANPGIRIVEWDGKFPDCLARLRAFVRESPSIDDRPHEPQKTVVPDDSIETIAGDIVLKNELTEEDRSSSDWALIYGFSDYTFLNRTRLYKPGNTWPVVECPPQRYRIHVEDLPSEIRGSKRQRDERLKMAKAER